MHSASCLNSWSFNLMKIYVNLFSIMKCNQFLTVIVQIIRNTFRPFTTPKMNLSQQMISELMHRFSSNAGYQLDSEVLPFFKHLRQLNSRKEISRTWPWQRTIVGVISNSDNRICGVLQSFGLAVIPRRTGALEKGEKTSVDKSEDISFVLCSYDAGYEKPDKRIFAAATDIVDRLGVKDANLVHVGDSKREDVLGAINAGWNAVLLNPQKEICEELLTADDIKETEETVKPNTREDYRIQRIGNLNDMWKWRPLY